MNYVTAMIKDYSRCVNFRKYGIKQNLTSMHNVLEKCKANFGVSAAMRKSGKMPVCFIFNNSVDAQFHMILNVR